MDNISLGLFLKNARIAKGYSLRYLASISGVSFQQISLFENDKHKPHSPVLRKLCFALSLDFETVVKQFYCIKYNDSDVESITLGIFLKNARILKDFTQQELSDLTGISIAQISFAEKDMSKPRLSNLRILCFALEVDFSKVVKQFYCIEEESDSDTETLSLGAYIKNARLLKGLTYQGLSELVGICISRIHNIEYNNVKPSLSTLKSLCSALDIDYDKAVELRSKSL